METSFVSGWAIVIPLLILCGTFVWWLAGADVSGRRRVNIKDVPCDRCRWGYGTTHWCDSPDYCPCDRAEHHTPQPDGIKGWLNTGEGNSDD